MYLRSYQFYEERKNYLITGTLAVKVPPNDYVLTKGSRVRKYFWNITVKIEQFSDSDQSHYYLTVGEVTSLGNIIFPPL